MGKQDDLSVGGKTYDHLHGQSQIFKTFQAIEPGPKPKIFNDYLEQSEEQEVADETELSPKITKNDEFEPNVVVE